MYIRYTHNLEALQTTHELYTPSEIEQDLNTGMDDMRDSEHACHERQS